VPDIRTITFEVKGQDPAEAMAPLFSNFLAVSRVGTDVQFEFVYIDLNQLAAIVEKSEYGEPQEVPKINGKTVGKIVMPAASFIQLKDQMRKIFGAIEKNLQKSLEVEHEHSRAGSG